ncbi:hypothetical protein [Hymenobacter properus]|jgi:hypothetical protein|uniref:Uncharacterized protein n=1 Tax=Hymenobacter properus TaxID=2791026 RepID=A0A931BKQ8_9BACT|nr:hypothetical protein [Hymenobacter properus]MBF9144381.1 hypothetical protein [Hymenobacter properus]MBR7723199.1 hypothetical protein [Microvirga sp. SRT04]
MWSKEELKTAVQLAPAVLAGLFGVVVAILSWMLGGRRERSKFRQDLLLQNYNSMEDFYVSLLEMLHEGIRYTESRLNYDEHYRAMSPLLSRAMLKAPEEVLEHLQTASDALSAWSSEYRQGLPAKIGDTGYAMVSTQDFPHQEKARELRPLLNDEMHKLNAVMKKDLDIRRKQLRT